MSCCQAPACSAILGVAMRSHLGNIGSYIGTLRHLVRSAVDGQLTRSGVYHRGAHDPLRPVCARLTEGFNTLDLIEAKAILDELS